MRKNFIKATVATCLCTIMIGGVASFGASNDRATIKGYNGYAAAAEEDIMLISELYQANKSVDVEITSAVFKKTYKGSKGQEIKVRITYPVVKISDEFGVKEDATELANQYIYKKFVAPYTKYKKTANVDKDYSVKKSSVTIEGSYIMDNTCTDCSASTVGNLLSVKMSYLTTNSKAAYPTSKVECLNINMTNGRAISLSAMFKKNASLRELIAEEYKLQNSAFAYIEIDGISEKNENQEISDIIKEKLSMANIYFTYSGLNVVIDESVHGIHALGTIEFTVAYDDIENYIKSSKKNLLMPSDMILVELPSKSAGTGYSWDGDETGNGAFEVVYSGYKAAYKSYGIGLCGGPEIHYIILKSTGKTGSTTLHFDYLRTWEGPDSIIDSYDVILNVDADGSIERLYLK